MRSRMRIAAKIFERAHRSRSPGRRGGRRAAPCNPTARASVRGYERAHGSGSNTPGLPSILPPALILRVAVAGDSDRAPLARERLRLSGSPLSPSPLGQAVAKRAQDLEPALGAMPVDRESLLGIRHVPVTLGKRPQFHRGRGVEGPSSWATGLWPQPRGALRHTGCEARATCAAATAWQGRGGCKALLAV
jgi:hypothetical protein